MRCIDGLKNKKAWKELLKDPIPWVFVLTAIIIAVEVLT